MSRLPIRVRLTLVFVAVMAVMLSLLGAFLYLRLQDSLDERIADQLENRALALATAVETGEAAALDPSYFRSDEGVADVVAADGRSLFPSGDPVLGDVELQSARRGLLQIERGGFRVRAQPVAGSVVVVGESLEDRDEALAALLTQLLIALPLALLVASGVGYLVAGAALRPVEEMRRQADEISAETPDRRLPLPRARDEIYRLGETLNEMLARLDAALERERRFVGDASHELRTPLAALRTELELATNRPRSHGELEAALLSAREEVERLVRLAEDLLVLARSDAGRLALNLEPLVVREVLGSVASRHERRARAAGREIEVVAPPDATVVGDGVRLEQAVADLVDNALRHGGGAILIEALWRGGSCSVVVSDDGGGFPPEFLPHAFERFSRADTARSGGGAGLGLAIVDAIARAHGGHVEAANRAEGGAIVSITIPCTGPTHPDLI